MFVPAGDLATVGTREPGVDSLPAEEPLDLRDGRAAVDLRADRVPWRARERVVERE
jgi:hypothetical protein